MAQLKLNEHQALFFDASEQYVGLFGGVGNGKTFSGCLRIIELASREANNLCLVGRLTYPELRDSTKEVFMDVLNRLYHTSMYSHNKAENSITLANKSTIIFRHLDNNAALLGPNLGAFYIDQAEEVDEDAFLTLQSRLRRPGIKNLKGLITGNPQGHNWVYYKFGMNESDGSDNYAYLNNYRMITAATGANAHNLPPNYISQLKESYGHEWFQRYVMGSWDAMGTQIFEINKITGYTKLPEIKMVFTAIDPAISKEKTACNTAICTLGVGIDGHVYDLETIADHWTMLETMEELRKVISRQNPYYVGIEDVAYQSALTEIAQNYYPNINIINLDADKDKFRRAKGVSHIVSRGLFHTNNKDLMSELSAFDPGAKGKERKDRVDAMVHALRMVQRYAPIKFEQPSDKPPETSSQWFYRMASQQEKEGENGVQEELYDKNYNPPSEDFY